MVTLQDLLKVVIVEKRVGNMDMEIKGIAYDSRKVKPGYLFVCIEGFRTDGHNYIAGALANGAVAVVVQREVVDLDRVPWIKVPDTRRALAYLSARFYDYPSTKLKMVGVTGTNGKTTITYLVEAIMKAAGYKIGLIGTIQNKIGDQVFPVTNTTPMALELQELLNDMVEQGVGYAVMEVSSHALELGRVDGCEFDVAVFTNITQDHLDFHGTMENYLEAKSKLFSGLKKESVKNNRKYGIINKDDPHNGYLIERTNGEVITYGVENQADIMAAQIHIQANGVTFDVTTPRGEARIRLATTGMFSVYNALAAIAVGFVEGIDLQIIKEALEGLKGVAGRFEPVDEGQDFAVIVDYAHTPDGLENILKTAREFAEGRIITVFGCGGDRDKTKRPIMGRIAAQLGDFTVITSDNPRSEDPATILDDVEAGTAEVVGPEKYMKVVERREAIRHAITMAKPGDIILIAGKGHETYQIIGDQVLDFDDREVARGFLRERRG
ncbi:MAG: UDP-N-acetylmuramoyl-L-alanyl-D-glutamate--2,6-diaminopimelate ligase [Clostridia bacterium]|nr:UDP-N-acetylmuramoyl-L-alanyl-D-glutamate--2,6-diaminopimelate ligase [Clostridia bacterium]